MSQFKVKMMALKGFNKEDALSSVTTFKTDLLRGSNSTQAWFRAGRPIYGTSEFTAFCIEQLTLKTKGTPGLGCYVVIEPGVSDTRTRPYSIISNMQKGTRKYKRVHQIVEVNLSLKVKKNPNAKGKDKKTTIIPTIVSLGKPISERDTLAEALAAVKELTTTEKKHYIIQTIQVTENPIEAYCIYTPASIAKEGVYVAFGVEI